MTSTTHNHKHTTTDLESTSGSSRRPGRHISRLGVALALALGLLGATAGLHDAAHAEPTSSPTSAPVGETSKSHLLKGQLFVESGVHLTLTSFVQGEDTYATVGLPWKANPNENGQKYFDFEYYTDSWFHTTMIEYTYRVEGTNDEVWIKVTKRPALNDITKMEVRNAWNHDAAFNPTVTVVHHEWGHDYFEVRPRAMP